MGKNKTFEIATEDGSHFCDCKVDGDSVRLYGKEGQLSIESLIAQIKNPKIAQSLRRCKSGRKTRI